MKWCIKANGLVVVDGDLPYPVLFRSRAAAVYYARNLDYYDFEGPVFFTVEVYHANDNR